MIVLRTSWRRNCKRAKCPTSGLPVLNKTTSSKSRNYYCGKLLNRLHWLSQQLPVNNNSDGKGINKKKYISNGIKNKAENGQWRELWCHLWIGSFQTKRCVTLRREKPQVCSVYQSPVLRMKTSLMTKAWQLMGRQSHKSCISSTLFLIDFWVCGFLKMNNQVGFLFCFFFSFFSKRQAGFDLPLERDRQRKRRKS